MALLLDLHGGMQDGLEVLEVVEYEAERNPGALGDPSTRGSRVTFFEQADHGFGERPSGLLASGHAPVAHNLRGAAHHGAILRNLHSKCKKSFEAPRPVAGAGRVRFVERPHLVGGAGAVVSGPCAPSCAGSWAHSTTSPSRCVMRRGPGRDRWSWTCAPPA